MYSFDLYDDIQPERVLFLKGDIYDEQGDIINDLEIEIKNLKTQEIKKIKENCGNYAAALTLSQYDDVLITIKKKGYAFNSQYISYDDTSFHSPKKLDFEIKDIEEGESFVLDNIYFDLDSYSINEITKKIVYEFAEYLKLNNDLIISIDGYTDNIGEIDYNLKLSENRALAVYNELIKNGIPASRLSYKGYGESKPKNANLNDEQRKINRRTEFFVKKK